MKKGGRPQSKFYRLQARLDAEATQILLSKSVEILYGDKTKFVEQAIKNEAKRVNINVEML